MFYFLYFHLISAFVRCCYALDKTEGWNYINLHCRDNNNEPVDWWYIYKPPADVVPFYELGRNFSFITPNSDQNKHWQASLRPISSNSMLEHTLSPLFRATYVDYLAYAVYEDMHPTVGSPGSMARGLLMADEMGGLFLTHTVPGFPDLSSDGVEFPEEEYKNGHLLMCLSMDLVTLNEIVTELRNAAPKFTTVHIPKIMRPFLPNWKHLNSQVIRKGKGKSDNLLEFVSRRNSLQAAVLVRRPNETHCLYRTFARTKNIVLDVYGQSKSHKLTVVCGNTYSVRNIETISLKLPESVYYVVNKTDRARFAVSTAAHWQRRGSSPPQYWACISNLDKEDDIGKGGVVLCVENQQVWQSFDNFKVKEPTC